MSLRLLLDMNLSPELVDSLGKDGFDVVHWSTVGDPRAGDSAISAWARAERRIVITHALDFGAALAISHAAGPSIVQIRTQDVLSDRFAGLLRSALRRYENDLLAGALIVVEEKRARVRLLPL